ncbi:MAG: hypothetical protein NWF04_04700 [Candidatus Bathyarchaeota archaeon]|nr:hypothetical protein [Candidatus Bathyarchaeota archaeon]
MPRLRCKKCQNVFEQDMLTGVVLGPHIGPFHFLKCPACGKRSFFNLYSSVSDPVTWPPQEPAQEQTETQLSDEELERKRIEDSKYEKP